jgi:hypothetical protein
MSRHDRLDLVIWIGWVLVGLFAGLTIASVLHA